MKIKQLNPTKNNPRLDWTTEQQEAFKKSLREFGDLSGIIYNRRSKQLVGGNKRRQQFVEADAEVTIVEKLKEADTVGTVAWGHVEVNGTRFNYREVDWPKKKELAANLAANQHGAEFDWQGVSDYMKQINDIDYLSVAGFEPHDIENLIAAEWKPDATKEMPTGGKHDSGEQTDMIVLDEETRKIFNKVKKKIRVTDDLEALKKICETATLGLSS